MSDKLKVSFNSPQCGWMSVGFEDATNEFHTTTAHAPHKEALSNLLNSLAHLLSENSSGQEFLIHWNRDPEEFDFWLKGENGNIKLEIWLYATGHRNEEEREIVFRHEGGAFDVCTAFLQTFEHMYEDRDTDEFEQNWRQPFPEQAFERFKKAFETAAKTA
jgi:hypothetical protein